MEDAIIYLLNLDNVGSKVRFIFFEFSSAFTAKSDAVVRQAQGHADEHLTCILDDGLPELQATVCKTEELGARSLSHGKSISSSS